MSTKNLKSDQKSDFLLDKGIELLWSKGYNATSVNDIVKAAEIPKGSFYFYFSSKEDFAVKALEKYFNEMMSPTLEVLQNKTLSPKQRLHDFYDFRSTILKEQLNYKLGCMGCNLASEMAEHNESIRKMIAAKSELIKNYITDVIEEAQNIGELSMNIKAYDLAGFIEDAGKGAMTTMKEMQSAYPIDNFLNLVKNVLLK